MTFFYGRYGIDTLSIFLLFISTLFNFNYYTHYISFVLLIIIVFRLFSRNKAKRQAEHYKFIQIANKLLIKFKRQIPYNIQPLNFDNVPYAMQAFKKKFAEKKQFKIVSCPKCGQKLRLPRGKNKIIVTCKRCAHEFKIKT